MIKAPLICDRAYGGVRVQEDVEQVAYRAHVPTPDLPREPNRDVDVAPSSYKTKGWFAQLAFVTLWLAGFVVLNLVGVAMNPSAFGIAFLAASVALRNLSIADCRDSMRIGWSAC